MDPEVTKIEPGMIDSDPPSDAIILFNGKGHCAFTAEQIGKSFDELRRWVKTGDKAKSGLMELSRSTGC